MTYVKVAGHYLDKVEADWLASVTKKPITSANFLYFVQAGRVGLLNVALALTGQKELDLTGLALRRVCLDGLAWHNITAPGLILKDCYWALGGIWDSRLPASHIDGGYLQRLTFFYSNFEYSSWRRINLRDITVEHCVLEVEISGGDLLGIKINRGCGPIRATSVILRDNHWSYVNAKRSQFNRCYFIGGHFEGCNLSAVFQGCHFVNCLFAKCTFDEATFNKVWFYQTIMTDCSFKGAKGQGVTLEYTSGGDALGQEEVDVITIPSSSTTVKIAAEIA